MPVKISINGVTILGGNSISVSSNRVIVDGKDITPDSKVINIEVNGNIPKIDCDVCNSFKMTGDVGNLSVGTGDVDIEGDVSNGVEVGTGDFLIDGNVSGSVRVGTGDVKCRGNIGGNVRTGCGDISR